MSYTVRPMMEDDIPAVQALWRQTPGVGLSASDGEAGLRRFLARNPALSFVALAGERYIGAALCGHDGRRGYIHHLAVAPAWRRRGVGRALVARCLAGLAAAQIDKCHIFVFRDNQAAHRFWQELGWTPRGDLGIFSQPIQLDATSFSPGLTDCDTM